MDNIRLFLIYRNGSFKWFSYITIPNRYKLYPDLIFLHQKNRNIPLIQNLGVPPFSHPHQELDCPEMERKQGLEDLRVRKAHR